MKDSLSRVSPFTTMNVSLNAIDANTSMNPGEFKHEVRQFQKPYDNQQAEQISLMV